MKTRQTRSLPATVATVAAVVALGSLAGCGGTDAADDAGSPTSIAPSTPVPSTGTATASPTEPETTEPAGTIVTVEIENGDVSPKGKRVPVAAGEPITFEITADVAGELHVHSTPELEIPFEPGTTTHELTLDQPGVVDVELHEMDVTVVQLEVR